MSSVRSDAEVLTAIAEGDRRALRLLYDRHAPWLTLRLARRCADPGVVDETVQDTFVAVWRGAGRFAGRGEVGAWIWGIVVQATLLDDLTTKEAGRLLGIPQGTVKTRMMRARAQLREELA